MLRFSSQLDVGYDSTGHCGKPNQPGPRNKLMNKLVALLGFKGVWDWAQAV